MSFPKQTEEPEDSVAQGPNEELPMNKTTKTINTLEDSITVSTESLARLLDCGRITAVKIGNAADAKIKIGRRVLWNSEKIREYINTPHLRIY